MDKKALSRISAFIEREALRSLAEKAAAGKGQHGGTDTRHGDGIHCQLDGIEGAGPQRI